MRNIYFLIFFATFSVANDSFAQLGDADAPFIPNVITPNNDGQNDRFEIRKSSDSLYTAEEAPALTIVNRWGKTVYESRLYLNQWDAYGLESGQYYYVLQLKSGRRYSGNITVIK